MQDEMHRTVPFWHRPGPKTVLPWITSMAFHATLVALMVLLVPPLIKLVNRTPPQAAKTIGSLDPNTKMDPLPGSTATELPPLPNSKTTLVQGEANTPFSPGEENNSMQQAMRAAAKGETTDIGQGNQGSVGRLHGKNLGDLLSKSDQDVPGLRSPGNPDAQGPAFFTYPPGIKLPKSVCFICDASGSMNDGNKADVLREALKAAVNRLAPIQQFNVFLFQQGKGGQDYLSESDHLMMATPTNRTLVADFMDNKVGFHGQTNAVPALREAFKEKPEVIFLLTDGLWEQPGPDGPGILKLINQLNVGKQVCVNTVLLFVDQKDEANNASADQIMQQIAGENGGTFKKCLANQN